MASARFPTDAVAVSLNVTALGASTLSFLTFWPDGERPLAASLNPAPGEPPTPNAVTVDLSGAGGFNVYNDTGTVNVVIDVNGYYIQASLQELASRLAAVEATNATQSSDIAAVETDTAANTATNATQSSDIAAVETDTAANTATNATQDSDIAAVEATNTTQNSDIAANTAGVGRLDEAQPFAVTERDAMEFVEAPDEVVVFVEVTAPVAGHITVNSTTNANDGTPGDRVNCSITTGMAFDFDYRQRWESSGTDSGDSSQLAGTRRFDVAAGATVEYNLVCFHVGSGSTQLLESAVTAIFTPAP